MSIAPLTARPGTAASGMETEREKGVNIQVACRCRCADMFLVLNDGFDRFASVLPRGQIPSYNLCFSFSVFLNEALLATDNHILILCFLFPFQLLQAAECF